MYCACFSVGKMCDQVKPLSFRLVFVSHAKIMMIIWRDQKQSTKSLLKIPMHFLESMSLLNSQNVFAIAKNPFVKRNTVIVIGGENNVDSLANALVATIKKKLNKKLREVSRANSQNCNDDFLMHIITDFLLLWFSSIYIFQ